MKEENLLSYFSRMKDPRVERTRYHLLDDIIFISIASVLSGAESWNEMERYGNLKKEWLSTFLELPYGIPSHDTFNRFFSALDPIEFEKCFSNWVSSIFERTNGEVICIDGKTMCGARYQGCKSATHIVSAWADQNEIILGQLKVDEKSNEITAIPQLLDALLLQGCVVTIDAMGCQTAIAEQVIAQQGDYVLGLKGNQGTLHDDVEDFFQTAQAHHFKGVNYDYKEELDKAHGRLETRRYWVSDELSTLADTQKWEGLNSIGMVERECIKGDVKSIERRYFINSIAADAKIFAKAVRGHWGVENPLHWRLDVVFGDDVSRIRKGHAAAIMTSIRHLCMNLFQQEPSSLSLAKEWARNNFLFYVTGLTA